MPEPSDLDRSAVRRQFDRRVASPEPSDFLTREVERRMLDRLDLVKLRPDRVLDVGCGLGDGVRRLRGRWPQAEVVGVDLAPRRVARAARVDRPPASARVGAGPRAPPGARRRGHAPRARSGATSRATRIVA